MDRIAVFVVCNILHTFLRGGDNSDNAMEKLRSENEVLQDWILLRQHVLKTLDFVLISAIFPQIYLHTEMLNIGKRLYVSYTW